MQMPSHCFNSAVMENLKLYYCYSSGILSLSVRNFSFYTVVFFIYLLLAILTLFLSVER